MASLLRMTNETVSRAELAARYDGEWVIVGDPVLDELQHVLAGRVLAHGKDREAVTRAALPYRGQVRCFASLCFVKEPENVAYAL